MLARGEPTDTGRAGCGDQLDALLQAYRNAPEEYRATSYWSAYEARILEAVRTIDLEQLRSGRYPILATFGFNDVVYTYHPNLSPWKKVLLQFIHRFLIADRAILPYGGRISGVQEIAYRHCELAGELAHAVPIGELEVCTFGNPGDLFRVAGRAYTMAFLGYYLRYCFAHRHAGFRGDEIVVELGSGSGYQVEVLRKAYPGITVLCFDLPAQIYLCQQYLRRALGDDNVVGTEQTLQWTDLSGMRKGCVHFFGCWQFPLLRGLVFDLFWNAASFGEMEPSVVGNYLSWIKGGARWVYLLQSRRGKETRGRNHVQQAICLEDYTRMLEGYVLRREQDAWQAHMKLVESSGYFEGVWERSGDP